MSIEERVRQTLSDQSRRIGVNDEAWSEIEGRLNQRGMPVRQKPRQRILAGVVAIAVFGGAAIFAWQALHPSPLKDHPGSPAPADVARVVCSKGAIRIETPVVRAYPDGVHFAFENPGGAWGFELHHQSWEHGKAEGGKLADGVTHDTSAIGPGDVTVACLQHSDSAYDDSGTPAATITVVDPDGLYVPWALSCGFGKQSRITVAASENAKAAEVFQRVPGVRSSDAFMKPNYPESPQYWPTLIVFRGGTAVARIGAPTTGSEWQLIINACAGSGISGA